MADSGGGTQTRAHKKKLEQGARVPNQRDLGLMSTGKQGLCRAGIALAAVGPGGLDLPTAGEGSPIPCFCHTPDSRRHTGAASHPASPAGAPLGTKGTGWSLLMFGEEPSL